MCACIFFQLRTDCQCPAVVLRRATGGIPPTITTSNPRPAPQALALKGNGFFCAASPQGRAVHVSRPRPPGTPAPPAAQVHAALPSAAGVAPPPRVRPRAAASRQAQRASFPHLRPNQARRPLS